MTACKRQERFARTRAVRQIGLQYALDGPRRILRLHVVEKLAGEHRVWSKSAADVNVIALDRIAVVADGDARRQEADVADIVLRAGMMAAGEMNIHRPVEGDARFAPV